jgi:hypothetical protein
MHRVRLVLGGVQQQPWRDADRQFRPVRRGVAAGDLPAVQNRRVR